MEFINHFIEKYRQDDLDVAYVDETWINKNHACEGGWTHNKTGPTGLFTSLYFTTLFYVVI